MSFWILFPGFVFTTPHPWASFRLNSNMNWVRLPEEVLMFRIPIYVTTFVPFWGCVLAWNEAKAEASLLQGIRREHPEILEVIGTDGTDEITVLPLRQFQPLWLNATSLPKGCTLTEPPTQSKPVHTLITSSEFELLTKYSCNSIYLFINQILDGTLFYEAFCTYEIQFSYLF